MDLRSGIRIILAALIGIGLLILVIVLFAKVLGGGSGGPVAKFNLVKYAGTDATAQLYIDDAPINNDAYHTATRIIVGQNQTELIRYKGYQDTITDSRTYANNQNAYAVFLRALDLQGFTRGNNSQLTSDERGVCPQGTRYIYSFYANGHNLFRYWTTSCGDGTFRGNKSEVFTLFQNQIPPQDQEVTNGSDSLTINSSANE